jgi:predicted N-acetyltransferase YhbS
VSVVAIRTAGPDDVDAIRGIFRRASLSNPSDRVALLAHPEVLEWSPDPTLRTRVAVDGDTAVGFASTVPTGAALELEDLFVDPPRMRQGVARRLVADVLVHARAAGVEAVEVSANPDAMAFYTAVGFRPIGTAETRFGPAPRLILTVPG